MIKPEDLPSMLDGLPVHVMKPPTIHKGDYLATLHQWGELPEVVPIIGATNMLAVLVKQNPAALAKVLRAAIESGELPFWGWNSNRANEEGKPDPGWTHNMIMWLRPVRKVARANAPSEPGSTVFTLEIDDKAGRIHWEATGVNPADAVALLVKRGRKVPPELQDFIPASNKEAPARAAIDPDGHHAPRGEGSEVKVQASTRPIQRSAAQEAAILAVLGKAGHDPKALSKNVPGRSGVKAEARAALEGKDPMFPQGSTIFDKAWVRLAASGGIAFKT